MTLSDISIKKPVFAWMLMAGLLVFGAIFSLIVKHRITDPACGLRAMCPELTAALNCADGTTASARGRRADLSRSEPRQ